MLTTVSLFRISPQASARSHLCVLSPFLRYDSVLKHLSLIASFGSGTQAASPKNTRCHRHGVWRWCCS
ncbi:hypothetical protein VNO77_20876 [Canavalia gladiata]|uniref:Uncharacterized protein n=1 Tax=Canavalia gladiata TaxID=3824 RepID=A0AAN9LQ21_CANGL